MSRFNLDRIEGYERLSPQLAEKLDRHRSYLDSQKNGLFLTVERIGKILEKPLIE